MSNAGLEFLMMSLSNEGGGGVKKKDLIYSDLQRAMGSSGKLFPLKVPALLVGTLDSLMTSSEELTKADSQLRQLCGNISRTYKEIAQTLGKEVNEHVNGLTIDHYVERFTWDVTKFPYRQNRPDRLMTMLRSASAKIDSELRQLSSRYGELKSQMGASTRKTGGNLMVKDLNEILGSDSADLNSEFFTRVVVVVPKARVKAFEEGYDQVDKEAVPYGPDNDRWSVKGSPVVPGSLQKRAEDMETNLYTVIVLRRFVEGFKSAVREDMRGVVRDFVYEPEAKDRALDEAAELERDYDVILMKLFRWCDVHFGEAIMVWIHVKMLRLFVESVLRYGLPVDFTAALGRPKKGQSDAVVSRLAKAYSHLDGGSGGVLAGAAEKGGSGGGGGVGGVGDDPLDFFPFVAIPIESFTFN